MIPLRITAQVTGAGKLVFNDIDLLKEWLSRYSDRAVEVVFQTPKKDKTQPQLGYLFGHVIPAISEYTGHTEEEVYGILKYKLLKVHVPGRLAPDSIADENDYVRSLADCTREEVAKFIDSAVGFGTQLGAEIYPPQYYGGNTQ